MIDHIQILIGNGHIAVSVPPTVNIEQINSATDVEPEILQLAAHLVKQGPSVRIFPFPHLDRVLSDVEICRFLLKMFRI